MTRKDYELIAGALAQALEAGAMLGTREAREAHAEALALATDLLAGRLTRTSPRFSPGLFVGVAHPVEGALWSARCGAWSDRYAAADDSAEVGSEAVL